MTSKDSRRVSKVSATTALLFEAAGLRTARLDKKFDRLVAKRHWSTLGSNDYYVAKLRKLTSTPVCLIARHNKIILMHARWNSPIVSYEETSKDVCNVRLNLDVPAIAISRAQGRKLEELIGGLGPIGDLEVMGAQHGKEYCLINLKQSWGQVQ